MNWDRLREMGPWAVAVAAVALSAFAISGTAVAADSSPDTGSVTKGKIQKGEAHKHSKVVNHAPSHVVKRSGVNVEATLSDSIARVFNVVSKWPPRVAKEFLERVHFHPEYPDHTAVASGPNEVAPTPTQTKPLVVEGIVLDNDIDIWTSWLKFSKATSEKFPQLQGQFDFSAYQDTLDAIVGELQPRLEKVRGDPVKEDGIVNAYFFEERKLRYQWPSDGDDQHLPEIFSDDTTKARRGVCQHYVGIYLGIADKLGLPYQPVFARGHVAIARMKDGKIQHIIETTATAEGGSIDKMIKTEDEFKLAENIHPNSVEEGVYLVPQPKKNFLAALLHSRARALSKNGVEYKQPHPAIDDFMMALRIIPNFPEPHIELGNLFGGFDNSPPGVEPDVKRAEYHLREAIRIDPYNVTSYATLSELLDRTGKPTEEFDAKMTKFLLFNGASGLHAAGEYEEAKNTYLGALNGKYNLFSGSWLSPGPEDAEIHFRLAMIASAQSDPITARKEAQKAISEAEKYGLKEDMKGYRNFLRGLK
ncbi:MAG: tetratricopeptide repeat protein [Candidatus Altiarchaeota archaeon]